MEMDSSSAARGGGGRLPTKDGPPFVTETHIPSVIVRTAANADVDAMHELVRAAYSPYIPTLGYAPPPMRKNYTELLGKNPVWVAVDADSVLIGLLELIVEVDHVIVENFAVAPIYHGRQLGRWLMDFAEAEARRVGLSELRTYTNQLMPRNVAIYKHLGYEETDRRTEHGIPRVFLRKRLTPE